MHGNFIEIDPIQVLKSISVTLEHMIFFDCSVILVEHSKNNNNKIPIKQTHICVYACICYIYKLSKKDNKKIKQKIKKNQYYTAK